MNRQTNEVGCGNQYIDLTAIHQPRDLGRKTRRHQGRIIRWLRQFKHEIKIATLRAIVQPRTENTYASLLTCYLTRKRLDGPSLIVCQTHYLFVALGR